MKRFLLTCLLLLAFYAVLAFAYDGCVLWLMRHSPSCTATKIERAINGGNGEKIAIFGSSRALGNYMPSVFPNSTFNYGINGMSLNETLILVDQYLRHNLSDSTIVINLDPWGFGKPDAVRLVGDYRLVGRKQSVRESIPGLALSWVDCFPGFRFQGQLRISIAKYMNARKAYTKKIDNGAELLLNSRTESEWKTIKNGLKPYSFFCNTVCDTQLASLYARQGRHRIVWVVAPACSEYHALHGNPADMKAFLDRQDCRPNVSVVDLFDEDYHDMYFVDPTHLNVKGAQLFSNALVRTLNLIGGKPS